MSESIHLGELDFEVRRSARRRTLALTVDRAGALIVHAPQSTGDDDLRRWVERKLLWVHRKLAQKVALNRPQRAPEFVSGESFFYLGRHFRLRVVDKAEVPLCLNGDLFLLRRADRPEAVCHFRRWYVDTGTPWLSSRVQFWVPRLNAVPVRIEVGDLGFHWGSCGKKGALHFNWRLLQLPVRLIDYVVAHELTHLVEHHHGPEFWRVLDRALPDWRERKATLESAWQAFSPFGIEIT